MQEKDNKTHSRKNLFQPKPNQTISANAPEFKPTSKQQRPREKKPKKVPFDLGFKFTETKQTRPVRMSRGYRKGVSDLTLNPYYRFSLKPQACCSDYHLDPNAPIDWDSVAKVTRLVTHEYTCPICLEHTYTAGRVNKCGHCYCWPCAIRYFWATDGKKCPVCHVELRPPNLRPVEVVKVEPVHENSFISMKLMRREKGKLSILACGENLTGQVVEGFVENSSNQSIYNRVNVYTHGTDDYNRQLKEIQEELKVTEDSFEHSALQKALKNLKKESEELVEVPELEMLPEPPRDTSVFYYFYQLSDSQPYFLHPLNVKMLLKHYGSFCEFPALIRSRVFEVTPVYITETEYKTYRFLTHIAKGATVFLVELDMKKLVSAQVFSEFKPELEKRKQSRIRAKKKEERTQAMIARRRKEEEEANNLLVAYFQNPQVAQVKQEEQVKPQESSSSEEESKSIWSSFGQVLKEPPKPRPPPKNLPKKAEDEEDSPKPTLFDLLKYKSQK